MCDCSKTLPNGIFVVPYPDIRSKCSYYELIAMSNYKGKSRKETSYAHDAAPISRMFRKRLTPVANMQTTVKVTCAASEARESREG